MRPTVEYKGWKAWGRKEGVRHSCPYKISPPGNYVTPVYEQDGKHWHCNGCGARLPDDVYAYFNNLHNLLVKSGM